MKRSFWIIFFVLGAFLLAFQHFITVNIPWWDDFQGILLPVDILRNSSTFSEKFEILFSQNNEHRVVIDRLVLLFISFINNGEANMKWLAVSGSFLLIGLAYLLVKVGRKLEIPFFYLLIIPLLLFSAHNFEILQSLMVPYQIFAVLLFSFSAFYLAAKRTKVGWLLLLSFLAIFSHGNGLLTIPIIAIILFLTNRKRDIFIWLIYSVLVVSFYFYNYTTPPWNNNISPLEDPLASFLYFFEFLGSFAISFVNLSDSLTNSGTLKSIPTLVGLLVFGTFLFVFVKRFFSTFSLKNLLSKFTENTQTTFLLSCLLFVFATGLMMALKRTGFPMNSRYVINSQLFVVLTFLFAFPYIKFQLIKKGLVLLSLLYFIISAINYTSEGLNFKNSLEADAENWKRNGVWLSGYTGPSHTQNLNPLLNQPLKSGVYVFPETWLEKFDNKTILKDSVETTFEYANSILKVEIVDTGRSILSNNYPCILKLESSDGLYISNFDYKRNSILTIARSGEYLNNKPNATIYFELLPQGLYSVSILKYKDQKFEEYPTAIVVNNSNDFISKAY